MGYKLTPNLYAGLVMVCQVLTKHALPFTTVAQIEQVLAEQCPLVRRCASVSEGGVERARRKMLVGIVRQASLVRKEGVYRLYCMNLFISVSHRKASIYIYIYIYCNPLQKTSLSEVVTRVLDCTFEYLLCEKVTLLIVDAVRKQLFVKETKAALTAKVRIREDVAGFVAETGECIRVHDLDAPDCKDAHAMTISASGKRDKAFRFPPSDGLRNVMCIPVLDAKGNVQAVLQALNKTLYFTKADEDVVTAGLAEVANVMARRATAARPSTVGIMAATAAAACSSKDGRQSIYSKADVSMSLCTAGPVLERIINDLGDVQYAAYGYVIHISMHAGL
jgi:hypothetical protein